MTTENNRSFEELNRDPEHLLEVLKTPGGLKVSIVLPIATERPDSEQNAVRLKDLMGRAADGLSDNGLNPEGVKDLLRPVENLLEDPRGLLRQADGLAILVDDGSAYVVEIPYPVEAQVTVGNRFLIKPFLPLLQHDSNFTAACLNRGEVKIYQGTRLGIREIEVPNMPTSLEEVTRFDDPEKSIQQHTSSTGPASGRSGSAPITAVHGQGLPSDLEQSQIERFFRDVAHALEKHLANIHAPLVVFGVDENLGLFHSFGDWSEKTTFDIHHDPKDWSPTEILRQATEVLMPHWTERISAKVERLKEALQKKNGISGTAECVVAASNGRLEMACVASDRTEPGVCEAEKMKVEFVKDKERGCVHDLLDTIAYETLRHGGDAFSLPTDEVPGSDNAAAITRF